MRVRVWVSIFAIAMLVHALPSCGGGGGGPSSPSGPPATTPPATTPPATTLPPAAGGPTLSYRISSKAGKEPLNVAFDLSGSRDGSGGTALTYLADFEGNGFETKPGPNFAHTYNSDGVTVRSTQICVEDSAGRRVCATEFIKSFVDVGITVKQNTGCAGTIDATADLKLNGFAGVYGFGDVSASTVVDKVEFEAFNAAGRSLGTRGGSQQNPKQWMSGLWDVKDTTKLRVKATVFSRGVRGDDVPETTRPPC
jgi:hypothetical protein